MEITHRALIKTQIRQCIGRVLININNIIIRISKHDGYVMLDTDNISEVQCKNISITTINTDLYITF